MNSPYLLDIRKEGHKKSGKFSVQLKVINFLNVIQNINSPARKIISEYADSFGHSLYFASFTDTSNEYWLRKKFLVILRPVAFCYVILLLFLLLSETAIKENRHSSQWGTVCWKHCRLDTGLSTGLAKHFQKAQRRQTLVHQAVLWAYVPVKIPDVIALQSQQGTNGCFISYTKSPPSPPQAISFPS